MHGKVFDLESLREKTKVFADRTEAGERLADLLNRHLEEEPLILAIPAGGVPVAGAICRCTGWPLDVAVVSKITLPWNSEAGYGAVAFDGSLKLNEGLLVQLDLADAEVDDGIRKTRSKVARRVAHFRGGKPWPSMRNKTVILVDDGLASGFTLLAAVDAVRVRGAEKIAVGVPTAHRSSIERVAQQVDAVYCANIRSGSPFAVADAYYRWSDVSESEAKAILDEYAHQGS